MIRFRVTKSAKGVAIDVGGETILIPIPSLNPQSQEPPSEDADAGASEPRDNVRAFPRKRGKGHQPISRAPGSRTPASSASFDGLNDANDEPMDRDDHPPPRRGRRR